MTSRADPVDAYVGSRVRMRRILLNIGPTALTGATDVAFQRAQKYEKGANRISASELRQISQFIDVPVTHFFNGLPGPAKTRLLNSFVFSRSTMCGF